MGIATDLKDLMTDTATWYALASRDSFGVPTYGSSGTSYAARLIRRHKLVRDARGDQVVSSAQLWLAGAPAIAPDDKVTLSDGTSPPIVAIDRFQDEDGASHTVVMFR